MTVIPCSPAQTDSLLEFVLPHEKMAVGLVSHILRRDSDFFLVADDGVTHGVFSFSAGGQILHCLPSAQERREEILRALTAFFRTQNDHTLFNIIGEKSGTELVQQAIAAALGYVARHEQSYVLLENTKTTASGASIRCVRCLPEMIDELLPLQVAYEREEVLWDGEPHNPDVTHLAFLHALRTQQIFALVVGGRIVAKGGTNALGKNCAQLGGVFTVPSEREKGHATELMRHVAHELLAQGKSVVLFAKRKNEAALRLYEKIGCTHVGAFKIAYY